MVEHVILTPTGAHALLYRDSAVVSGRERSVLVLLYRQPRYEDWLQQVEHWEAGRQAFDSLLAKGLVRVSEPQPPDWQRSEEIDFTMDCIISNLATAMPEGEAVEITRNVAREAGVYFVTGVTYPPESFRRVVEHLHSVQHPPFASLLATSMMMQIIQNETPTQEK